MYPKEMGSIIRDMRKQQGITSQALAEKAGISQSKMSKIETGAQRNMRPDEVLNILNILNAPQSILQQVVNMAAQKPTAFMQISSTFDGECIRKERESKSIYTFTTSLIPALLHTTGYHAAIHAINGDTAIPRSLKTLHARQEMMWEGKRNYNFVILEAALYTAVSSKQVQLAQLDRLMQSADVPRLRLGIIPTTAGLPTLDIGSFAIYDSRMIIDAVQHREITSEDPDDIRIYAATYSNLEHLASYNEAANVLVRRAMEYFR